MKSEQSIKLQYLMLRFFEGTIEADEFELLNQSLKTSDSVQTLYFNYLKLYLAMKNARYVDPAARSDLDLEDFLYELGQYENFAPPLVDPDLEPEAEPVCIRKLPVEGTPYRFNKYSLYTALTGLAAAVLFLVGIYFLPPRVTPEPVARILDSSQVEWSQEQSSKNGSVLFAGPLAVTKGTLRFVMFDGSEVSLRGPSLVDLEQINQFYLQRGSMRAIVPPAATGFTVRTPSGSIVDFGTEFTVRIDAGGKTLVEVFKGLVELRDSSNPNIFKKAQRLTVGQKGQIDTKGMITWSEPEPEHYPDGEIRVQWQCGNEVGRWANRSYWADGLIHNPELVAEFRAVDSPQTVLIDAATIDQDKIMGRRADVGLLGHYPVTVRMDGGQAQFEQLWVGRLGLRQTAEGRWIMSGGELILKGRDQVMLFVGDKCKGLMEVNGGRIEIFGAALIGSNEWYSSTAEGDNLADSEGVLVVNGGELAIHGILEIASNDSVGRVRLMGGQIQAADLHITSQGRMVMTGGELILEGDKTAGVQILIDAGLLLSPDREIDIEYDERDENGFGRDRTIIRIKP